MDIGAYLSGYADGEGCFCVSINKSKRHKFNWEIRPSFSISQNRDRANILRMFKRHLGCGSIRSDRFDKTLKFEVRSVNDLVSKVISHFERYPLLSNRMLDFKLFADVCRKMRDKKHLTREGLQKILQIADEINRSGKKKFFRRGIKL